MTPPGSGEAIRDVRRYTDQPLAREQLERILEAGRRSLSKVWAHAQHVAHSAATIALIAPLQEDALARDRVHYDLGQATMSIMLAATDLGVGSGHSAVTDQDRARALLGFPDGRFCAYLIALGYPADRPLTPIARPARRAFDEVVHWGRW